MTKLLDFFKVTPQYLIPQHLLSSLMHWFMHVEVKWIKNGIIRLLTRLYGINLDEAASSDPNDYPHFNAFFTRELKKDARLIDETPNSWCSPVDGLVSQSCKIEQGKILQAKCHYYSVEALVGGDIEYAKQFHNGDAAVIYLSPKDYHRIHMPSDAKLISMTYVPGDLFAVNPATVRNVEGLFARNERLVLRFENEHGPFCLVMVGAIFVGSMETVFQGKITPEYRPTIEYWDYSDQDLHYAKGDEIGRFNMGSTVVLLTPENQMPDLGKIPANTPIQMGQHLADYPDTLA
ncbi:archaetidylserine decarboxylase [Thiomicrorhabdus xiamenensis]|uniref:Phosphatidylserine decarboxylase proenzyme n=1 Tax=Thiomicrorhabdus xiamenensis TaxID=2739063 RepID=A0A7D4TG47_9GAMM|nr:archaetidylserine decarboxylase [Thiomicrorhabdus xiamenensis]QKI89388.1 phosphatidylserine decarboxylase [Thiomicrorhabdus xiamenensis]